MRFPHDEGSHPDFRLEWWYVTGWLDYPARPLGFQVTFFRARPELKAFNPSAFAPWQLIIAHAALSDPDRRQLVHAERSARAGFAVAGAAEGRVQVWIDRWTLQQTENAYRCRIPAPALGFDLTFEPTQPPLLQGENGYSRKGPRPESASYYYSLPHMAVHGTIAAGAGSRAVRGTAWFDHEWSSQLMDEEAVGWDWAGINLDGGAALMVFRMRGKDGADHWAGGALRESDGRVEIFGPGAVRFTPRRLWRSGRSGAAYPVAMTVSAGGREYDLEPLFDDQEHDTRATTGTIYWEGAVRALRTGRPVGLGYLELTGYWQRLAL